MKKSILILSCFIILLSCKQKPTYNPFDDQFNIDESYFKRDKLDTIWDTCGYYYLSKKDNNFEIFYGYLYKDLIGKGFSINIDTIKLKTPISYRHDPFDSINSLLFNTISLNKVLKKYGYKFLKHKGRKVYLFNINNQKIDTAMIYSNTYSDSVNIPRILTYTNKRKFLFKWN